MFVEDLLGPWLRLLERGASGVLRAWRRCNHSDYLTCYAMEYSCMRSSWLGFDLCTG